MRHHGGADPDAVLILSTVGSPRPRQRLRGRKGRSIDQASPAQVQISRATVVRAEPFGDLAGAEAWLEGLREDEHSRDAELDQALAVLNRALHAHRVARADPHARDVTPEQALVLRFGIGTGDDAVEGRYQDAWELPRGAGSRVRRSMEAPDERFAAIVGGRTTALACEELVLRARADVEAGRLREAALQARVALEALLAEMKELPGDRRGALDDDRASIGRAANAALSGSLAPELGEAVEASVERMESALRVRRLSTSR